MWDEVKTLSESEGILCSGTMILEAIQVQFCGGF